ncbi:MAG: 3-isopropylmalate dehydratase [Candidatus Omnitrophica bacterium]|nr:3-isopropylmalate dehydratase [Candidatus Omnitrophota bacterium]MDD5487363.1 3-isopropylmalate dehydratase [Candidatus Omnitrophota bacterium]
MANIAHRLKIQDDVNTDYIISGRYKFKIQDDKELAQHIFEDLEENFIKKVNTGDLLVAGNNFGCGSSREQAPAAIKASGIQAVIAKSFARIFYRNAFNVGLCLIESDTKFIDDMDELVLDLDGNVIQNITKGLRIDFKPLPAIMRGFLKNGGVIEYFRSNGGFDRLA